MIDETRYEWQVYFKGVLLGIANTEGRTALIKEKLGTHPIEVRSIEYRLVLKTAIKDVEEFRKAK